jgi:hypothetical protein
MKSKETEIHLKQNQNAECGELVLQKLFLEFVRSADRRIQLAVSNELEGSAMKN